MDRAERFSRWRAGAAFLVGLTIPLSISISEIVTALAMVLVLVERPPREDWLRVARNPVVWATLALFLLLAIGVTYSAAPWHEATSFFLKYRKLAYLPLLLLLCRDRLAARAGLMGLLLAVLTIMVVGMFLWIRSLMSPTAHIWHYSYFGSYIIEGVWIAQAAYYMAVEAIVTPRWRRYWAAASGLTLFYVLYLSIGRTGYVVAIALAILLLFQTAPRKWILPGIVAVALFASSVFVVAPDLGKRMSGVVTAMHGTENDPGSLSAGSRLKFYRGTLIVMSRHPIFGTGTGSFRLVYNDQTAFDNQALTRNPHNEYLIIGIQTGIVGVAVLLFMFAALWFCAARLPQADRWRARSVTLALAISCLFNSSLLDHGDGHSFIFQIALFYFGAGGREDQRHRHDA